jgi:uncharacterized protein YndB with AHSA1/START domain
MRLPLLLAAALLASPAAAAVRSATPNSFALEYRAELKVPPTRVYQTVGEVARWWNPEHSYSGKAQNLSLDLRAGGCFCERLAGGGGIEHLKVAYVEPGRRVVLTGALGPLLFEAVNGVMDLTIEPRSDGGSTLTMTYRAAGFASGNGDKLAPLVDRVLAEQVARLARAANP